MSARERPIHVAAVGLVACFVTSCDRGGEFVAPPPPEVSVSRPAQQDVVKWAEATGTTEATESVEIRARVEGWLESIRFKPGGMVKEGDLLFVIDPKPFEAKLEKAQAELATNKAKLELAEFNYNRLVGLKKKDLAADLEAFQAKTDREGAKAAVAAAEAAVEQARLDLGYTKIHAPISGRISRGLVDEGNLVGAGERTLLTTIVKDDPIYAYFTISERDLLEYIELDRKQKIRTARKSKSVLYLGVSKERGYPHRGMFDWADNRVDPGTGTLRVRGEFPNPDGRLVPGLFVRVRAPIDTLEKALLVPDLAVGMDQRGRYVLTVNSQDVVEYRSVEVGSGLGGMRVILKGMRPEDWVVVQGLQRARPGAKVTPVRKTLTPPTPATTQTTQPSSQPA